MSSLSTEGLTMCGQAKPPHLRCYFDKALPAMLFYKSEREQYQEAIADDVPPSTVLFNNLLSLPEQFKSSSSMASFCGTTPFWDTLILTYSVPSKFGECFPFSKSNFA
ncbi:hypothetical protein RJ639_018053 [Escallonia herrerae]|uniref:MRG domain-containing protein n=1 Tax=Escallonia herrerae TaxID=1293975 RepID=A0AA89AHX9_9ASTE|nr:hypothetical protein RJ639_018053 [Escallonia herrerae]